MNLLIMLIVLLIAFEIIFYFNLKNKINSIIYFSKLILKNLNEENEKELINKSKKLLKNSFLLLGCLIIIIFIVLIINLIQKDFLNYLSKLSSIFIGTIFVIIYYYVRKKIIKL